MARVTLRDVLPELRDTRNELHTELQATRSELRGELLGEIRATNRRLDALNGRVHTVVDAVADLRGDLATHRHDD